MSIKLGDVDITEVIKNEFRISVLERILDWIINANAGVINPPSPETIQEIGQSVLEDLHKKYPNSKISLTQKEQLK